MPSKFKSPYATSFKSAIKRGTPCWTAVQNIASRTNKTPKSVCESLFKAGLVNRQKIAGQWIWWPTEWDGKCTATQAKHCQNNMWQWFVDWCITSGFCTPKQFSNNIGSQQQFMSYCKKFFNKQFNGSVNTSKSKSKKSHARKPKRSTPKSKKTTPRNFKFPGVKSRSTQRFRKVA